VRKITQLWESSPKWWVHGSSQWLTCQSVWTQWPQECLHALAAKVTLIREANKLTPGQDINVKVPYAVVALMNGRVING
jgi:hypothetical protein